MGRASRSTCREARRWMARAFEERLSIDAEFRLEQHLEGCPRCRGEAELAELVREGLARQADPPLERLDLERSLRAIHAGIEGNRPRAIQGGPLVRRRVAWIMGWLAVPVAVAGLLLWSLGVLPGGLSSSPEVPREGERGEELAEGLRRAGSQGPSPSTDSSADSPSVGVRVYPGLGGEGEFDPTRLDRVRRELRDLLARTFEEAGGAVDDFLDAFEAGSQEFSAAGWPIGLLVQEMIRDGDPLLAAAACRYVGRHATRIGVARLEAALGGGASAAAIAGLVDAGPLGLAALQRAFWLDGGPALIQPAVGDLAPEDGLAWAEGALERAPQRAPQRADSERWIRLVSNFGDAGVSMLVHHLGDPRLDPAALVEAIASRPEAAGRALVERVEGHPRKREVSALIAALERVHPPEAYRFLRDQAWSGEQRERAVLALAAYPGSAPLEDLLELDEARRLSPEALAAAWSRALQEDAPRVAFFSKELAARGRRAEARLLLEGLTLASEEPDVGILAAPALVALAARGALDREERAEALMIAAEAGGSRVVPEILRLFADLSLRERDCAAACLIALHRIGGDPAVQPLLQGTTERSRERILDRLHGSDPASSRLLLARELEPVLSSREAMTWSDPR